MKRLIERLKPANGLSYYLHGLLRALLPLLVLVFVRIDFLLPAVVLILVSKWRMLAVRPRYWPTSIRSNAVDIIVGLSLMTFMANTSSGVWQLIWTGIYIVWLVVLKPQSGVLFVSIQALIGQTFGLMALFIIWPAAPIIVYVLVGWAICFVSARHFFTAFDERYSYMFSQFWGYFAAALMAILGHWLLFYGTVAQPTLLLTVMGVGLASIYYLDQTDRLTVALRRNFIFTMIAVVVVVLLLSDWGDRAL